MTVLIIDTDDKKDLIKAKAIAKENGWLLKEDSSRKILPESNSKKLVKLLHEFAANGGPTSFPKDVSAWQREIRKDKILSGR
jgi:hypothetical protein